MLQENQQKLSDLAYDLRTIRTNSPSNTGSHTLFLGGATSFIQNRPFIGELRQQVLLEPRGKRFSLDEVQDMELAEQIDNFEQKWKGLGKNLQTATLSSLQRKLLPSTGHTALAMLLKENYFPFVLTTTIDQLIESVFISNLVKNGQSLLPWVVLINDADAASDSRDARGRKDTFQRPSYLPSSPMTTIFKLCGSINMGSFAVTRGEVEEKIPSILNSVSNLLRNDLVIVGMTPLDELIFQRFLQNASDIGASSIYYINAERPSLELDRSLNSWGTTYIIEKDLTFDLVFQAIAEQLDVLLKVETLGGARLDKEDYERLRNQQSQSGPEAIAEYFKSSVPQSGTSETVAQSSTADKTEQTPSPVPGRAAEDSPLVVLLEPDENKLVKLMKETTVITITIGTDRKAIFTAKSNKYSYTSKEPSSELKFNLNNLNGTLHYMGESIAAFHRLNSPESQVLRNGWRQQAKQVGNDLYINVLQPIPELESILAVARGTEDDPENVTLVFEGPRQYLSMPYELLYYHDQPLVVQHPLCRRVSGVNTRGEHFNRFFDNLRHEKADFRALLIASGTPGTTSDEQVVSLKTSIEEAVQSLGVKSKVEILLTNQASIKVVRNALRNCSYHMVHYAGHGVFDEATGENSGLRLWQHENMSGERVTLTAREISSLLGGKSNTRLFYINACVGAEISSDQVLLGNDYLGLMDAIVQAGVPYVLGFRWYVTDRSSRIFASQFYQQLFTYPLVPEVAVLRARKRIREEDALNETWTSPILVAQTPYQ